MTGIIYDAGALVAAEHRSKKMWALHAEALNVGVVPVVPAVALAQVWRGGPQAELSRMLKGCEVVGHGETVARAAGKACGLSDTKDVVDSIVVVHAITNDSLIVTSDSGDIEHLLAALSADLKVHRA